MAVLRVLTVAFVCVVVATVVSARGDEAGKRSSKQRCQEAALNYTLPELSQPACNVTGNVEETGHSESCEADEKTFHRKVSRCLRKWKERHNTSAVMDMGHVNCSAALQERFHTCVLEMTFPSCCSLETFTPFYQQKGPQLLFKNINKFCCKPFQKNPKTSAASVREENNSEEDDSEKNISEVEKMYKEENKRFGSYLPTDKPDITTMIATTPKKEEPIPVMSEDEVAEANSAFALSLYRQLSQRTDGNIFFSPYSISAALAMTYMGARHTTAAQMAEVLHLTEGDFHQAFSNLSRTMFGNLKKHTLVEANKLFGQQGMKLEDDFLSGTSRYYNARMEKVDFFDEERSRSRINSWVSTQTKRKINDLIPKDVLNALTRLVLVNAVYFKGTWQTQFDPRETYDRKFFASSGNHVTTPTMHQRGKFRMADLPNLRCRMLELPYAGDELAMFVILPKQMFGLKDVEAVLTSEALLDATRSKSLQEVRSLDVALPKFRLTHALSLKNQLTALGMTDLFSMETADLSGVTGEKGLHVSEVLHKAFVEVNEEGSEAAAATAVVMRGRSGNFGRSFMVNRPFLFFIQHKPTGTILFLGRVTNPNE
ncbi:leukocyte elastase inhibitor A-like isoform X2 [Branchiostoma floridae]|uniref:Leukocyte elastase inhibitor A-like isoform X1 n=1 Tax=Branchiostoma floridae TaxID=7739 RepID=A0A9J7MYD1_BRAFL|nr:leukocyte elastase inhibitor A-like isoform X1 [Branchiostoma floridae]XP_035683360.1 leukocyte elastase inhibitor A-like isoform X2 [Branchiostoma floridae]